MTFFFAFVSFFPQLVAGPIERASNLLPQFNTKRVFNYDFAKEGLKLILWGLVKKIVIADRFSDSTLAYQGGGRNLDIEILKKVNKFATKSLVPHITFLIDINPKDAIARAGKTSPDRIEEAGVSFQNKVQKTYLSLE